jgi:RND family efflux transporter MFP subunit
MNPILRKLSLPLIFSLSAMAGGCKEAEAPPPPPKPPEVLVSLPLRKQFTDYEYFTGRTEAIRTIEIRARVQGYLDRVFFQEGTVVEKNTVLFEIDPRPYKAALDQARANLASQKANAVKAEAVYKRTKALAPTAAVAKESLDTDLGNWEVAKASVEQADAALQTAQLNLTWTKVTAPIRGRLSRQLIDPGNLVKADETALTTIVSTDPMYAYFDVDERTYLRVRRMAGGDATTFVHDTHLPVMMGLADEDGFPRAGTVNFEDNRVDAATGTMRLRGVFANTNGFLSPGLYVRIRLPIGSPYSATVVAEQALATDQGQKFLYVINDKDEVVYRPVKVGRLHEGLRVITDGLKMNEKVVVTGLQRVRHGAKVVPKLVDMPLPEVKNGHSGS